MIFRYAFAALIGILTAHSVFASEPYDTYKKIFDGQKYKSFIVVASMSQQKEIGAAVGGPGGHIAVYVEGLCIDYTTGKTGRHSVYKPCWEVENPPGFEHTGVWLSVDADLYNTNFLGTPGYELGMNGLVADEAAKITKATREEIIRQVLKWGVYNDVKVKADVLDAEKLSGAEYRWLMAKNGVGTDFGFRLGRDVLETFIPISFEMVPDIAKMLNARQRPYIMDLKPYLWNAIFDNCAMLVSAVLEIIGVRPEIKANLPWYKQIFNLALPRNGYSTVLAQLNHGGRGPLAQFWNSRRSGVEASTIIANTMWKKTMRRYWSFPMGVGVISREAKMFQNNDLYNTDVIVKSMTHKIIGANKQSVEDLKKPEFTHLRENATYWRWMLQKQLTQHEHHRFGDKYGNYVTWLDDQLELAEKILSEVDPCRRIYLEQGKD